MLKRLLIIWLQYFSCSKIHLIKLLTQLLPVKILVGKVNLLSTQTNFAPIELGMCFWYSFVFLPSSGSIIFNEHSISA